MDGLNGKMSEINAALGVVNIKYLKEILDDRENKYKLYKRLLSEKIHQSVFKSLNMVIATIHTFL